MKFSGSGKTGGQARFWTLLDVRGCYSYLGDCHECLGQAERELVAPGDISRAESLCLYGLSPLGSRMTFLAVTVAS